MIGTTVQGAVGPYRVAAGVESPMRLEPDSALVVTELHGKYYEQARLGNLFWACMTAGVIFPAPGATASNPFTLANPAGSGRNIIPVQFDMVLTVTPGTPLLGLYGLYVNNNVVAAAVSGTAITPISGLLGSNYLPVAKPFSTSTVPAAPTLLLPFGQKFTGATTVAGATQVPSLHFEFDGRLVMLPGTAITPQQTVADTSNATVICAMSWYEVAP